MNTVITIKHSVPIETLQHKRPIFNKIAQSYPSRSSIIGANGYISHLSYQHYLLAASLAYKVISISSIIVIGKTGYGKSTLLNTLIGQEIFPTDPVQSCTSKIDAAIYAMFSKNRPSVLSYPYCAPSCRYFALCDLPGIGESLSVDNTYMNMYEHMLDYSSCVIYLLRADQRDYSLDHEAFIKLFPNNRDRRKVVIALNYADKIEPIHRNAGISDDQMQSLQKKRKSISKIFNMDEKNIIPCSAATGYGIDNLTEIALSVFQDNCLEHPAIFNKPDKTIEFLNN